MDQVLPVLLVVLGWAILFVGIMVFFGRALREPTETEQEAEHAPEEGVPSSVH
jgi:hypothetical protein